MLLVFALYAGFVAQSNAQSNTQSSTPSTSQTLAPAAQVVQLIDSKPSAELWPSVRVYADSQQTMSLAQAMDSPALFTVPQGAYGTLGLRTEPIWIKIPLTVAANSDGLWVLDIDYPPMNRLDVYLTQGTQAVQQATFSNLNSVAERLLNSRAHSLVLKTRPGMQYVLYLRAHNMGAMTLPIVISKPVAFHLRALDEQMLQGFLNGIALCFLLFSLLRGLIFRELFHLKYALLITGGLLFTLLHTGIGSQYLWFGNDWIEIHVGGVSAFIASMGSFLFIEHALSHNMKPWLRRSMKIGALLCLVFALCYAFDWIGVQTVTLLVSTLGLVPALLGLPGAVKMARRGQAVGWLFLLAWTVYFVTTAILVEVIKGRIGVSFWTSHSFQFGATFDMFVFMAVLGLQSKAIQDELTESKKAQQRLMALAHSDPLTNLPNRRSLYQTIEQGLQTVDKTHFLAVFMIDLDGFKAVNDRYGHDVGDELLVAVAQRLKRSVREGDMVSRLGGDEFVVVAQQLSSTAQAYEVGQHLLDAINQPFVLSKHTCNIGLTIGLAIAPLDGIDSSNILRQADEAMYSGKRSGKNRIIRSNNARGMSDEDLLALI